MKRQKLKKADYSSKQDIRVADRVATDLPDHAEIVVLETDNPHFRIEQHLDKSDEEIEKEKKQTSAFSLRDVLVGLRSRGHISDHQFQAGRMWQKYCHQAQTGSLKSVDFTQEAVDGGGNYEPANAQLHALREIGRATKALGTRYNALIWEVLWDDKMISSLALAWRMEARVVGAMLRDALDILAIVFGLASSTLEHSVNKYLT